MQKNVSKQILLVEENPSNKWGDHTLAPDESDYF